MYYTDLSIWGIILWVIFGLIVIFQWKTIVAIILYKIFQIMRLPRAKAIEMKTIANH